jgi:hypothetical protein
VYHRCQEAKRTFHESNRAQRSALYAYRHCFFCDREAFGLKTPDDRLRIIGAAIIDDNPFKV